MKKISPHGMPVVFAISMPLVILAAAGGAAYFYYSLLNELTATRQEFSTATTTLGHDVATLTEQLAAAQSENEALHTALHTEINKNNEYGKQVESLVSTVTMLDKLSKTDRELLQKYSNVYFLSENYVPSSLTNILPEYALRDDVTFLIHTQIAPHLSAMMDAAKTNGSPLLVLSAYRSFGEQAGLKSTYKVTYGAGSANQFSADQGYSEHQLGSTVDFTTKHNGTNLDAFEASGAFRWLEDHAHEYGFILSYPKGNNYFVYEPWHWRYVGVELATKLHTEGKNFYDLDQREINQYLVKIFD